MNIGKSVFSYFLSTVVASAAGFLTTFVIARFLGADVLGIYALAQSIIVWMTVPSMGISKATTKYISEGRDKGAHITIALVASGIAVAILAVALLVLNEYVQQYVGANVTVLIVLLVVTTVGYDSVGAIMKGEKHVARFGWLNTGEKVLRAIFQIAFVLIGYKIVGILVGHALSLILVTIVILYFLDIRVSMPDRDEVTKFLDFAKFSWVGGLKIKTFGWMDTLVLGFFVSSSLIGVYEVAWTLSSFLVLASNSIRNVVFPELSELSGQDQRKEITSLLGESIQYTGLIIIPGFFGALVVGPRVLKIYSPEFVVGGTVLVLLILAQMVDAYGRQFVDVLNAIDRPDAAFWTNLTFTGVNLSLNVALIYLYGWTGAAVATLLSGLLTLVLGYAFLHESLGGSVIPYVEIGKQVFCAAVMAAFVYGLADVASSSHYATIAIVFSGAAVYGVCLYVVSLDIRRKAKYLVGQLTA